MNISSRKRDKGANLKYGIYIIEKCSNIKKTSRLVGNLVKRVSRSNVYNGSI
jgi:3-deoxy-D-arabino-heptulosonate 7-phosphate (DAHP) synthase